MHTAFISHADCLRHDTGTAHPEAASRLHAIEDRLNAAQLFDHLRHLDAPEATREQLLRVHDPAYLEAVESRIPDSGYAHLDPDTVVAPHSLSAARRAAGAVVLSVDRVMSGECANAFCSVRPPGHHAERNRAMGFCLFNNVAVGAAHALAAHGLERVAIVDFDVHHGNGTEAIFRGDSRVLFCSTFQHPFYPNIPCWEASGHIVCAPLDATAGSAEFRAAVEGRWLPALDAFQPELILVSAGFDAHVEDDMSGVSLTEHDYRWVTEQICGVAARYADNRIVSTLEGGYEGSALGRSVEAHLRVLMGF
jgi:acetoin utilization deacetylase AcuC-like enzyme